MSPRRRSERKRNFPANLYEDDGYFSYRNPKTGEHIGIGRDRRHAFQEAMRANAFLLSQNMGLVERIAGQAKSWGQWCDDFELILAARASAANTQRMRKSQLKRLRGSIDANRPAAKIDTAECAAALDAIIAEGKHRMAQAMRSFMIDCFDRMIAKGIRKDNPARVTDPIRVTVNRARLEFDVLQKLYAKTEIPELRNAIALALVTGQPRECIAAAVFKDQIGGQWENHRGKTDVRIRIPHELRLDCFGMSLGDVVAQCRKTGVVSQFLIHRTRRAQRARIGSHIHVNMLTRLFTDELATLGLSWGDKDPPTFHEIRSLSERLYVAQGGINTQDLLGHKDPKTTSIYHDPRGEWVQVVVRP